MPPFARCVSQSQSRRVTATTRWWQRLSTWPEWSQAPLCPVSDQCQWVLTLRIFVSSSGIFLLPMWPSRGRGGEATDGQELWGWQWQWPQCQPSCAPTSDTNLLHLTDLIAFREHLTVFLRVIYILVQRLHREGFYVHCRDPNAKKGLGAQLCAPVRACGVKGLGAGLSAPPDVGTGVVCRVLRGVKWVIREGIAASVFFSSAWKDEWESPSLEDLISSWIQVHLGLGRYFFVRLVLWTFPW